MKRKMMQKISYMLLFLLYLPFMCIANSNVVNLYIWGGYIPESVIAQFTQETGIKVNFSVFDSNEELYAKIATANQNSGYDVIVPSSNYVTRMQQQGMLEKINKNRLTNYKNLNPLFLNKAYDPHNEYSVPYLWGSTGIMINKRMHPHLQLVQWKDLWHKSLINQVVMIDELKEPFEISLKVLGYPTNSRDPQHIKAAYEKLIQLLPNIKLFNNVSPDMILASGDVGIAVLFNGAAYLASRDNPNLHFIYPKDGVFVWTDCMAIPKNAPHLKNAYKLINFILRADIAAKIAAKVGYSTPNRAALRLLPTSMRDNYILYPSKDILRKANFETDLGAAESIYQHYWQLLKLHG